MRQPKRDLKKIFKVMNLKYDEKALSYFCEVAPQMWHVHKMKEVDYKFLIDVAYLVFEAHEKTIKSNSTKS